MLKDVTPGQSPQSASSLTDRKSRQIDLLPETYEPVTVKGELVPQPTRWSVSLQTVLDQPPASFPGRIMLGGLVFCVAFGVWAHVGVIDEVGHSQGRLVPKGEVYKVNPVELGKVASIQVTEGQTVKTGQVLLELDTELAKGEVERLEQLLSVAQLELAEKQFLLDRTLMEVQTRQAIANADSQGQQAAIAQANAKAAALTGQIAQQKATKAANAERLARLKPLVKAGALSKEVFFQADQNFRERVLAVTQSQGELNQTKAELDRLQAGLAQKSAEGNTTRLQTEQKIQQIKMETTQTQAKVTETRNLLAGAKTKLKQRYIYSPINGTITSLHVSHSGEVVQPGQNIAEIARQGAPLILMASLPSREAGFVKPGMPVQLKFEAFPYQEYGIIPGKVMEVSADAKQDEKLGPFYQVQIALERNAINSELGPVKFKAGQTASAEIVLRRRHIADILLDPIKQLQKGSISM
jgi:hemolysin D